MTKPSVELFKKMKALLTPEGAWGQGDFFLGSNGHTAKRSEATCFCILGAAMIAGGHDQCDELQGGVNKYLTGLIDYGDPIWIWNDKKGRTQQEVLGLLDKAIVARKKEELNPSEN